MFTRDCFLAALTAISGLATAALYYFCGYSQLVLGCWLGSVLAGCAYYYFKSDIRITQLHFDRRTLLICLLLFLGFGAFYLTNLDRYPVHVSGDELHFLALWQFHLDEFFKDPLGMCERWWHLPNGIWILPYFVSRLAGDVSLEHMRFAHSFMGVITIVLCYLLYKLAVPQKWALAAAALLGTQHVLLITSRFGTIDNSQLLVTLASFNLFIRAARLSSPLLAFLGGATAGLSFYLNFPGRLIVVVWFAFVMLQRLFRIKQNWLRIILPCVVGFILVVIPAMVAIAHSPLINTAYSRDRTLLYPEGRELQMRRSQQSTEVAAVLVNIFNGLTVFNNPAPDTWGLYWNKKMGFVDPITGCLVWIGIASVFVALKRNNERWTLSRRAFDDVSDVEWLLFLTLISYYLALSFIANLAPVYGRAILMLPAVELFVIQGIRLLQATASFAQPVWGRATSAILLCGLVWINLSTARNYIVEGLEAGDTVGSLFRYAKAHPTEHFVFVHDGWDRLLEFYEGHEYEDNFLKVMMKVACVPKSHYLMITPDKIQSLTLSKDTTLMITPSITDGLEPMLRKKFNIQFLERLSPRCVAVHLN